MSTKYIKDKYQEPIFDIPLDILAFDLLKIISEVKLPVFVRSFLKHQSDNDNDNIYNYLKQVVQYLEKRYIKCTGIDQDKKVSIITKAGEQWLNDAPYDMPSHIRIPPPIIVYEKK